jgi:signal peptide peptidase SppA
MNTHNLSASFFEAPLLIRPTAFQGLLERAATSPTGRTDSATLERFQIGARSVAVIPVHGIIASNTTEFDRWCGCVDVADIAADLENAASADAVVLDIDSPGGMVSGTPELADMISAMGRSKPIYAFTSAEMCSAAYWLGASASGGVFTTRTGNLGSIGVYMPFLDQSEYLQRMGLKVDLITSGKFKGMGAPGTSLTPDQREFLQTRVNDIAAMFGDHVTANRPSVSASLFDGRVFMGQQAVATGLADAVVRSMAECF